jgi:hypothetical protein
VLPVAALSAVHLPPSSAGFAGATASNGEAIPAWEASYPFPAHGIGAANSYGRGAGVGAGLGVELARRTTSNCVIIPSSSCSII